MAKKKAPAAPRPPRQTDSEADRIKSWMRKIRSADKLYTQWEKKYAVRQGERYYEGFQGQPGTAIEGQDGDYSNRGYVINLTLAAIETQKPSLLFYKPQIRIEPRPSREDLQQAGLLTAQAKLAEQVVQTFMDDPDVKFMLETGLTIQEAHTRFGVVEVGYTADFIDNPHAGKPRLPDEAEESGEIQPSPDAAVNTDTIDAGEDEDRSPEKLTKPGTERVYVKRIPAKTFRVALSAKNDLTANDFVAYYEWQYVSDLRANKKYRHTSDLKATGTSVDAEDMPRDADTEKHTGMAKVWKVWDLRGKVKHVLVDGHDHFLLEGEAYAVFPFADLKFIERVDEYYPLPVIFNWISPQDELNEQREQAKNHRRRFERKFTSKKGAIDDAELSKLLIGGDGTHAWSNSEKPLEPMPDAPLDAAVWRSAAQAEVDFTMISGVSAEQRQVASAETATQASIMDGRARLRESAARMKVAGWIANIARLMLLNMREMTLPFLVKQQLDLATAQPEEVIRTALLWKEIQSKDIGTVDFDVTVDLASMSPVTQDAERIAWNQVLALLSNPTILLLMAQSPVILRKTLGLYGVHSEPMIQEISKVALGMAQQLQQAQQQAQMGASGGMALPAGPKTLSGMAGQPGTNGSQMLAPMDRLA